MNMEYCWKQELLDVGYVEIDGEQEFNDFIVYLKKQNITDADFTHGCFNYDSEKRRYILKMNEYNREVISTKEIFSNFPYLYMKNIFGSYISNSYEVHNDSSLEKLNYRYFVDADTKEPFIYNYDNEKKTLKMYSLNDKNSGIESLIGHWIVKSGDETGITTNKVTKVLLHYKTLAEREHRVYILHDRAFRKDYSILISLDDTKFLEVSPDGITERETKIPIFKQNSNNLPFVYDKDGTKEDFEEYLKILRVPEDKKFLMYAWGVNGFIFDNPQPIILLRGGEGTGKTTMSKYLQVIHDPNNSPDVEVKNDNDLFMYLRYHRTVIFENISYLDREKQDIIAKIVTGTTSSERKLYTNNESITAFIRKSVIINGIGLNNLNPDLLDRSILIESELIPKNMMVTDSELKKTIENLISKVRGYLLKELVKVLKIQKEMVENPTKAKEIMSGMGTIQRMSEFNTIGELLNYMNGIGLGKFTEKYTAINEIKTQDILIENDFYPYLVKVLCEAVNDTDLSKPVFVETDSEKNRVVTFYTETLTNAINTAYRNDTTSNDKLYGFGNTNHTSITLQKYTKQFLSQGIKIERMENNGRGVRFRFIINNNFLRKYYSSSVSNSEKNNIKSVITW